MKRLTIILLLLPFTLTAQQLTYPTAQKSTTVDTFYHHYIVPDPWRWMEDINTPDMKEWLEAETSLSDKYLRKAGNQFSSKSRIDQYSYAKYKIIKRMGKYYFGYGYYDNLGVPALFYKETLKGDWNLLVDPNYISSRDNITIDFYRPNKDSKLLAYEFNRNGSDWAEVNIVSLEYGSHLKDHLVNLKFSPLAWRGDGFYYSRYPNAKHLEQTLNQEVYYHKVGTLQEDDQLVFKRKDPSRQFDISTSHDERFFILKEKIPSSGTYNVFYTDFNEPRPILKPLLMKLPDDINIIDAHDGKLIAKTFHNTQNGMVVEIDPKNPYQWKTLVPEFPNAVLRNVVMTSDKLLVVHQEPFQPVISVYDYNGQLLNSKELLPGTNVSGFNESADGDELTYYLSGFTLPRVLFSMNLKNYEHKPVEKTEVSFDYEDIVVDRTFYTARDSAQVPIFLVYMKGMEKNGNNPVLLEGYGGFGVLSTPHFDPGIIFFLKKGGIFAYAGVRGGGDLGSDWALAGRDLHKQTCINDFIDGATWLISQQYTNPTKLAITGASHGGMLVAAAAIQRPELFQAVVPQVGVFDLMRLEKFTVGNINTYEFGTVTDSTEFVNMLSYSPLQNIQPDVDYPAMLIMTSDNDDRVPPFQSYKFTAALQNRKAQTNPILLRIEKNAGHYGSSTLLEDIDATADKYSFILSQLLGDQNKQLSGR